MDLTDVASADQAYPHPVQASYVLAGIANAQCASLALRLGALTNLESIRADLHRLWLSRSKANRRLSRVEFSVVEPCAGTRAEREQDAMRLLALESSAHRGGDLAASLRVTLVTLDPDDHLLLVAAPASTTAAVLRGLIEELAQLHPPLRRA